MNTMFYRVGLRAEVYAFIPLVEDAATDLAEQAAADFWKRTGIANSSRPLKITLLDERGQHYGMFDVAVVQAPIYRATPMAVIDSNQPVKQLEGGPSTFEFNGRQKRSSEQSVRTTS